MFENENVLRYCEKYGIYEVYSVKGNVMTYYSYFGGEGFYRITKNVVTGREVRKHLRYTKPPKFLLTPEGYTKYNYFTG